MTQEKPDLEFECEFLTRLCSAVDTPRSLAIALMVKHHEFEELLALTCDPAHYNFAGNFADDYLVTQLMRKSVNMPLLRDPDAAAYASWLDCQEKNRLTNERFKATDEVDLPYWWDGFVKYLHRVLGPLDHDVLGEILEFSHHGPGAVAGVKGKVVVESDKYDLLASVSAGLLPFAPHIMGEAWYEYKRNSIVVCNHEVFFTVLKDATVSRCCAKGQSLNVFGQLGIGSKLQHRLRLFGVDLSDQGWNQFLASKAQQWGLATIDLKTASELMASEPVSRALPDRWLHLFNLFRSTVTKVPKAIVALADPTIQDDQMVLQHKFCAMGNGFTFPLQTAVFLSVVRAIVPYREHVDTTAYGDDIVCPQAYAKEVCAALEYLGFSVNTRKTYLAGRFFESCGTDWFDSQNVRPFYLRRDPESAIPYSLSAANSLYRWMGRRRILSGRPMSDEFEQVWRWAVSHIPGLWRNPVPESLGDTGVTMNLEQAKAFAGSKVFSIPEDPARAEKLLLPRPVVRAPTPLYPKGAKVRLVDSCEGWEGYAVKHVRVKAKAKDKHTPGVLLSRLNRLSFKPTHEWMTPDEELAGTSNSIDYWAYLASWLVEFSGGLPFSNGREPVRRFLGLPKLGWTSVHHWS